MANLIEVPEWVDGIYRLETSDRVLGGEDGTSNVQGKQLANRTSFLKQAVERAQSGVDDINRKIDTGAIGGGAPLGSIVAFMGTVAPAAWLLCNGQTFDTDIYPDLFKLLGKNTTPDLRGEFLRGAGTNSRANCGNGGVVGQHQDPTMHAYVWGYSWGNNRNNVYAVSEPKPEFSTYPYNIDSMSPQIAATYHSNYTISSVVNMPNRSLFMASRPTNTSVNYIIKAT